MEPKIIFSSGDTAWSEVAFTDIAERISIFETSGKRPAVEYEDIVSGEGILNKDIYAKNCNKKGVVFNKGDVLFGKLRPYLRNILLADFEGVAVGDFWVLRSKGIEPYILYKLVNSKNFMKVANISSGSKMPRADWNLISRSRFYISSSLMEQQQIASYFRSIDSLVSTSTFHLVTLKQIKAASLQSMFPQEGETTPRIRFKGFEGEWKRVLLEECLKINTEKNIDKVFGINDVLSVSDEVGVVNQIKLLGRSYAGKSVSGYNILKTNQIVYTKSPLKSKPYGIIKVNRGEDGIVSVLYAVYDTKVGVSSDYIHYYFAPCFRINNYLLPLVNKGAKNTMNISDEMALQGYLMIPSFEEQMKIADYFKTLDRQITLQTRRLEKLKQIKAACLDKMFV